jgi:hypothetical protein
VPPEKTYCQRANCGIEDKRDQKVPGTVGPQSYPLHASLRQPTNGCVGLGSLFIKFKVHEFIISQYQVYQKGTVLQAVTINDHVSPSIFSATVIG